MFGDINVGPAFLVQANSLFTNIGLSLRIGMAKVQFFGFFRGGKFTGIYDNYYSIISLFNETKLLNE